MPQIIVRADRPDDREGGSVMLRERINVADFESERFAVNLVERIGWAVSDAADAEDAPRGVERVPDARPQVVDPEPDIAAERAPELVHTPG